MFRLVTLWAVAPVLFATNAASAQQSTEQSDNSSAKIKFSDEQVSRSVNASAPTKPMMPPVVQKPAQNVARLVMQTPQVAANAAPLPKSTPTDNPQTIQYAGFMKTNQMYGGVHRASYQEELPLSEPTGSAFQRRDVPSFLLDGPNSTNAQPAKITLQQEQRPQQQSANDARDILFVENDLEGVELPRPAQTAPARRLPPELMAPRNQSNDLLQTTESLLPPPAAIPNDLSGSKNARTLNKPSEVDMSDAESLLQSAISKQSTAPGSTRSNLNDSEMVITDSETGYSTQPAPRSQTTTPSRIDNGMLPTRTPSQGARETLSSPPMPANSRMEYPQNPPFSFSDVSSPPPATRETGEYHSVVLNQNEYQHVASLGDACACGKVGCSGNGSKLCNEMFYLTIFGGNNMVDDLIDELSPTISGTTFDQGFGMKDGVLVGGALGIYHGRNLRAEYELTYRTSAADEFFVDSAGPNGTIGVDGDLSVFTGMSNVYWDFTNVPFRWFTPYVGAGAGFAYVDADFHNFNTPVLHRSHDNDSAIAYQWIVGGNKSLTQNVDVFAEYRVMQTANIDFQYNPVSLSPSIPTMGGPGQFEYVSKNILFGLRIRF
ncbi:MAG: outer membrane beta-barrel protein [Pirellulaceae bacterium]